MKIGVLDEIQIVGHGLIEAQIPDDVFTIRFRDWQWQMSKPAYGKRTDVSVINVSPDLPEEYDEISKVWVCRSNLMKPGRIDISQWCEGMNSTGSSTINAAWNLLKPKKITLYGFTALFSGKQEKRFTESKKYQNLGMTHAANLDADREYFEAQKIPIEFVL